MATPGIDVVVQFFSEVFNVPYEDILFSQSDGYLITKCRLGLKENAGGCLVEARRPIQSKKKLRADAKAQAQAAARLSDRFDPLWGQDPRDADTAEDVVPDRALERDLEVRVRATDWFTAWMAVTNYEELIAWVSRYCFSTEGKGIASCMADDDLFGDEENGTPWYCHFPQEIADACSGVFLPMRHQMSQARLKPQYQPSVKFQNAPFGKPSGTVNKVGTGSGARPYHGVLSTDMVNIDDFF